MNDHLVPSQNQAASGRFDAAVIGGGPAGSSAALALARCGCRVLILERAADGPTRPGETLPPHVRLDLEGLGLWPEFLTAGHLGSSGLRSAWGRSEPADNSSLFDPYGPGWHIDRWRFDRMLRDTAIAQGARLRCGVRLDRAVPAGPAWELHLHGDEGPSVVEARFVVDASGRSAAFARSRGVRRLRVDRLVGVVGYVDRLSGVTKAEHVTLIEAVESGWWYSAPIPDGRLVFAFMSDADLIAVEGTPTIAAWLGWLGQASLTRARSEGYSPPPFVRVSPAETGALATAAGADWIAVGDAAAGLDPLSGQGIARALRDGRSAARAVVDALAGDRAGLDAYRRHHAKDFVEYLAMRHAYYRLEQRWSGSPFWARRHGSCGDTVPISRPLTPGLGVDFGSSR
jgi:flavin-dependent dehydrogenase